MGLAVALARGVQRRWQTISDLDAAIDRAMSGGFGTSSAGTDVSVQSALGYSTVWACIQAISEDVASLPCILYRRLPDSGRERAIKSRLYEILHDAPNPEMTAMDYWQTVVAHTLTWGNHYSQVVRDDYGARELWPLEPQRVIPMRDPAGRLYYDYRKANGQMMNPPFEFRDIFHVHGFSLNGLTGLSPIGFARESIGLGLSLDEYAARYFGNGAKPGGVLEHPGKPSKEAIERLTADWTALHGGPQKSNKTAVLAEGMKWHQLTIPPEDSQFLESREWQAEEICRWYRMPPHKVGLLKHATFSNIEHQAIEYVVDTIRPTAVRIEKAIQRDIIGISDGKRDHYAEFLVDGLLRGDMKSRYEAYAIGRQNGWLNGDDIHRMENLNPMPDGQGEPYLVNGNMKTIDQVLEPPESPPAPQIQPPAQNEPEEEEDAAEE